MTIAALVARLVLVAVFSIAGASKLASLKRTASGLADFGVPQRIAPAFAAGLILAELANALLLLPPASVFAGSIAAMALLAVFSVVVTWHLLRGETPACNCFGEVHASPIGPRTLLRNAALALCGLFVFWQARNGSVATIDFGMAAVIIGLGLLAAIASVLVQILRQQGRMLVRFDAIETHLGIGADAKDADTVHRIGIEPGTPAPEFRLAALDKASVALKDLLAPAKPLFLIFSNPKCGPCQMLMPEISQWQREAAGAVTIALISEGSEDDNREKSERYGLAGVLIQSGREVAELYQAHGTPSAVIVNPDGTIGSFVAAGADAIREAFARVIAVAPRPSRVGDAAPAIVLQAEDGTNVLLSDFRGKETVALYWNPECGFCEQMLADLRVWEEKAIEGARRLLVISSGTLEENRAMGLRSTVLRDVEQKAGSALGMGGTPMAVVIDAKGRIASDVAAGRQEVLQQLMPHAQEHRPAPNGRGQLAMGH